MNLTRIGQFPWIGSALLAIAVFAITLGGTYIYDDHSIIREDPRMADPSLWKLFLTQPYHSGPDKLYRPLVSLSYAWQWWLHGDRAWAFHLVNLLLHAAVSGLVAMLGMRLLGVAAGWLAGMLFAVHPVHVEAVAGIVGRAELLCAAGMVGGMVLLLQPMTRGRAVGVAVCFLIAVLSKEQGMLVPPLLLGLWWIRSSELRKHDNRKSVMLLTMLLLWGLAGYIVWRESIIGFSWERDLLDWTLNPMVVSRYNPHGGSIDADRWLMPVSLLGRYTVLLIAPIDLRFEYGGMIIGPHVAWSDPYLWIGFIALVTWIAIVVWGCRTRRRIVVFLAVGLALTYGMISNVVALIGVNLAERLMYIPSVFFLLLAANGLASIPRKASMSIATVLVVLGAIGSFTYAARWNDENRFYQSMLTRQPQSVRLHMSLVDAYRKTGRLDDAAAEAARGRELAPEYWDIWWLSGVVAMEQNRYDEAQAFFKRSFEINPDLKVMAWMQELAKRRAATTTRSSE